MKYSRQIYIALALLLTVMVFSGYIPSCKEISSIVTPPVALFTGLVYAIFFGQPFKTFNKKVSKYLLQYSVVGLGLGMNLQQSLRSGAEGMSLTVVSVIGTMVIGWLIGCHLMKINKETSYLVSTGTAICGGSAIAAVSPVIKADNSSTSVSLGIIFILNALALFIFPSIGRWLDMSDQQFGTWAAIAIHDTSSVVGAGQAFSPEALEIATTVKLTRALWIIPVALVSAFIFKCENKKVKIPMFILLFIVAILVNTYILEPNGWTQAGLFIKGLAHKCLTVTLFFIGASLSLDVLKSVGFKPFLMGFILWVAISVSSLIYIIY